MMEPTMNPIAEVSLIRLIRSSAKANEQILDQLKFFRDITGKLNIGIFIHDLTKLRHIWTNNNFVNFTGYTDSEIKTFGPEWAKDNYHPDDFHIMKERIDYFRENKGDTYSGIYRVKHKKGHWVWIYSNSTVFKRDANGIPEQIIGISIDFSANFKTDRQLDELTRENHRLRNRLLISTLTAREKEILKMIAAGKKDSDIAHALKISMHTVHSHRKNLLAKLKVHSNAELVCFAIKCGLD
jgi:PAS domain S-box-containing protein